MESLSDRFLQTGFSAARALTLKDIRRSYIKPEELARYDISFISAKFPNFFPNFAPRISSLEFLDETEELDLMLSHYGMSWGLFWGKPELQQDWDHWGLMQQTE